MKPITIFTTALACLLMAMGCIKPTNLTLRGTAYEDVNTNETYDAGTDTALDDVLIESGNIETQTDTNGNFSVTAGVYNEGEIILRCTKAGYQTESVPVTILNDESSNPFAAEDTETSNELTNIFIIMEPSS